MNKEENLVSRYSSRLTREPDGRPSNLSFLAGAGCLYLLSVFAYLTGDFMSALPLLGTVFALIGIAESLPARRQQTAFGVRLLSVLLVVVWVVGLIAGPQLFVY